MTNKDEGKEEDVNLFPFSPIPFTKLHLIEKGFKRTTQMNRVLTNEQNMRNLAIVGWTLLFIVCSVAAYIGLGEGATFISRSAVTFLLFGGVLMIKSVLMYLGLKRRKK